LWTRWRGVRGPKSALVDGNHELFGFLTTEANAIVAPVHPKAMPVILATPDEVDLWLEGETIAALKLQRPSRCSTRVSLLTIMSHSLRCVGPNLLALVIVGRPGVIPGPSASAEGGRLEQSKGGSVTTGLS
jgi:hypothetical protein